MTNNQVPGTRVLAIASHVVYGYVGNTMAAFVMQSLGCEVAALNTVNFSNHTGYMQFKGTKTSPQEIRDLYDGLKQSSLNDFDMLLTGYIPGAEAVAAVGTIARDLKLRASIRPGSFFWALDPVMGDEGKLYVDEDVVPAYKTLIRDADLILPNQFEAELLADIKIESLSDARAAIEVLHRSYRVPHIIITSARTDPSSSKLCVIGSSARSDGSPRIFTIDEPIIDCFFNGTGDMFAALTVVRLREAVTTSATPGLSSVKSWMSPDDVRATDLPLARAAEKVVASMQAVLRKTKAARDEDLSRFSDVDVGTAPQLHLRRTKAAEVRVVQYADDLRSPRDEESVYRAQPLEDVCD